MLDINRHNFSLLRSAACISLLSCLVSFVLMARCRKQSAQYKTHEQENNTSNNLPTTTLTRNATHLSDVDKAALQILLIPRANIRDADTADAQVSAVKLLGEHHCFDAIPILIDKINDIHSSGPSNIHDWRRTFPAASALVNIGDSSMPHITKRFETTNSQFEELLLLQTLMQIKGKVWVVNYLSRLQTSKITPKTDLAQLSHWVVVFKPMLSFH